MKPSLRLPLAGLLAFFAVLASSSAQSIHLNAGDVDTGRTAKQAASRAVADEFPGQRLHLVQFAGHHGAEIMNLLSIRLDPFAVRPGHDVDRRRRKGARPEQLRLFAAHHVMVIVARDA